MENKKSYEENQNCYSVETLISKCPNQRWIDASDQSLMRQARVEQGGKKLIFGNFVKRFTAKGTNTQYYYCMDYKQLSSDLFKGGHCSTIGF